MNVVIWNMYAKRRIMKLKWKQSNQDLFLNLYSCFDFILLVTTLFTSYYDIFSEYYNLFLFYHLHLQYFILTIQLWLFSLSRDCDFVTLWRDSLYSCNQNISNIVLLFFPITPFILFILYFYIYIFYLFIIFIFSIINIINNNNIIKHNLYIT